MSLSKRTWLEKYLLTVEKHELANAALGDLEVLMQSQRIRNVQLVCIVFNLLRHVRALESNLDKAGIAIANMGLRVLELERRAGVDHA